MCVGSDWEPRVRDIILALLPARPGLSHTLSVPFAQGFLVCRAGYSSLSFGDVGLGEVAVVDERPIISRAISQESCGNIIMNIHVLLNYGWRYARGQAQAD